MTAEELRQWAAELRDQGQKASTQHEQAAAMLASTLTDPERKSQEARAAVFDCMARAYHRWALAAEAAAVEIEEP